MFAVVTLEISKRHLVVPINCINQLNFAAHANFGVNSAEKHIVFYSPTAKTPNFKLEPSTNFDSDVDACYYAHIQKYFVDENKAKSFAQHLRNQLPKTYNDRKLNMASDHNEELNRQLNDRSDDEEDEEFNANKQAVVEEVATKIKAMSNLYLDLTKEEIDLIQNMVESDSEISEGGLDFDTEVLADESNGNSDPGAQEVDENVETSDEAVSEILDTQVSKVNANISEGTPAVASENAQETVSVDELPLSVHFEEQTDSNCDSGVKTLEMNKNVETGCEAASDTHTSELNELTAAGADEVNENVEIDNETVSDHLEVQTDSNRGSGVASPELIENIETRNEATSGKLDTQTSQAIANGIEEASTIVSENDTSLTDELPILSPRVPAFIHKLEPGAFSTQEPVMKKKNHAPDMVADSIVKHTLTTNHLFFNGPCIFKDGIFVFTDYKVELKFGIIDFIRGFAKSPFDSVFYDAKYVNILIATVIGNENFVNERKEDRQKMQFIKDAFMKRVGNDTQRLMRFGSYVEKRKHHLKNGSAKSA